MPSTLHVGNLSYRCTEKDLWALFVRYGQVTGVRMGIDRETGKPKGYAFVDFVDQNAAERARRETDNVDLLGRNIRVSFSEGGGSGGGEGGLAGGAAAAPLPVFQGPPIALQGPIDPALETVLTNLSYEQKYEIMAQMRSYVETAPEEARQFLISNPTLSVALLKIQADLGMLPGQQQQQQQQQPVISAPAAAAPAPVADPLRQMLQGILHQLQVLQVPIDQLGNLVALTPEQLAGLPADNRAQVVALQEQLRPVVSQGGLPQLLSALHGLR